MSSITIKASIVATSAKYAVISIQESRLAFLNSKEFTTPFDEELGQAHELLAAANYAGDDDMLVTAEDFALIECNLPPR